MISTPPAPPDEPEPTAHAWLVSRLRRDRRLVRTLTLAFIEELMAVEVEARCWNPAGERVTRRNGYRHALFPLSSGAIALRVPRLRQGGYAPEWLAAERGLDEDGLVGWLCAAYIDGVTDDDVDGLVAVIGAAELAPVARAALVDAMNTRIDARYGRLLLDVHGDDVTIEVRRPSGDDDAVAIATTTVDGDLDVLGVVVGAADAGAADHQLRQDLAARGLRGEVPAAEVARRGRRAASILTRRHGRGAPAATHQDRPRRARSRVPLLLAAVAALVLIAAVVVGTSAAERSNPGPPPATTLAPPATAPAATVAPPSPAAPVSPSPTAPTRATATTDCTTTAAGQRAPWMDQVLCEAAGR